MPRPINKENINNNTPSPTKSHASSRVSDSDSGSEDEAPAVAHRLLHEPPSKYSLGVKPKELTKEDKGEKVKLPQCCKGNKKNNHKKCIETITAANKTIQNLNTEFEKERHDKIELYAESSKKIESLEKFTMKQYKDGQKIVQIGHDYQDKLWKVEHERDSLKKLNNKMDKQIDTLTAKNVILDGDLQTLTDKVCRLKEQVKDLSSKRKSRVAGTGGTSHEVIEAAPENLDPAVMRDIQKQQVKLFFKEKEAQDQEKREIRRNERLQNNKDSRGKIGVNLLGMNGILNIPALLQQQLQGVAAAVPNRDSAMSNEDSSRSSSRHRSHHRHGHSHRGHRTRKREHESPANGHHRHRSHKHKHRRRSRSRSLSRERHTELPGKGRVAYEASFMAAYDGNGGDRLPHEEANSIFLPRGTETARASYNMHGRSYMHQESFDADDNQKMPAKDDGN